MRDEGDGKDGRERGGEENSGWRRRKIELSIKSESVFAFAGRLGKGDGEELNWGPKKYIR